MLGHVGMLQIFLLSILWSALNYSARSPGGATAIDFCRVPHNINIFLIPTTKDKMNKCLTKKIYKISAKIFFPLFPLCAFLASSRQ